MLNPFDRKLDETLPDWYVDLLVGFNLLNVLTMTLDGIALFVLSAQS